MKIAPLMTSLKKRRTPNFSVVLLLVTLAVGVETTAAIEGSAARDGSAAREGSTARDQSRDAVRVREKQFGDSSKINSRRLREGTIISDQIGFFREDGDGATFVADMDMEFGSLPNLNLERVLRLLKDADESSSIRWSVSGKVTEFSGRNFLLITRAVYKSATPPPVPDRVAP